MVIRPALLRVVAAYAVPCIVIWQIVSLFRPSTSYWWLTFAVFLTLPSLAWPFTRALVLTSTSIAGPGGVYRVVIPFDEIDWSRAVVTFRGRQELVECKLTARNGRSLLILFPVFAHADRERILHLVPGLRAHVESVSQSAIASH